MVNWNQWSTQFYRLKKRKKPIEYLAQIVDYVDIFFTEIVEIDNGEAREILKLDTSKTVLEKFIQKLQNLDGEIDREKTTICTFAPAS